MNLHAFASARIRSVNPMENISYQRSTGYTTAPDGSRSPSYAPDVLINAQVQELTRDDLKQIEGLNIQGEKLKAYFSGSAAGVVREERRGGDLIVRADGSIWLVTQTMQEWPDWICVLLVRQMPKRGA